MGAVTSTLERLVIDVTWSCHEWLYGSAAGPCILPRPDIAPRRRRHPQRHHYIASSSSSSSSSGSLRRHVLQDRKAVLPPAAPAPPPPPPLPAFPVASVSSTTSSSSDDDWPPTLPPPRRRLPRDPSLTVPQHGPSATSTPDGVAIGAATTSSYQRRRATMSFMSPANGPRRHHHYQHHHHHRSEDEDEAGAAPPRVSKRPNVPYSTLQAMLFRCTAARNGCLSSRDHKDKAYPVSRLGRSWSLHNAGANRAATL